MTGRAVPIVAGVVLAITTVVAGAVLLRADPPAASSPVRPAPPPRPAPSVVAAPSSAPATAPVTSSEKAIRPPASAAATAEAGASPAPFVQPFAAQPGVSPLPARPSPTVPHSVPPNVDGCDRAYGSRTQCVPWTFPASATDKCAWLAANGFTGLTVRPPDRHHLDPDGDGIACDR